MPYHCHPYFLYCRSHAHCQCGHNAEAISGPRTLAHHRHGCDVTVADSVAKESPIRVQSPVGCQNRPVSAVPYPSLLATFDACSLALLCLSPGRQSRILTLLVMSASPPSSFSSSHCVRSSPTLTFLPALLPFVPASLGRGCARRETTAAHLSLSPN